MTKAPTPPLAYLIIAAMIFYSGWMVQGWRKDATIANLNASTAQEREAAAGKLAAAERREREKESDAADLLATRTAELKQEATDAKKNRDQFIAGVRNGTIRLSIPVVSCSARSEAGTDSGADDGDRYETRAELTPAAAEALDAIADDGDTAIRQLNACIDAYNAVRDRFNVQAK